MKVAPYLIGKTITYMISKYKKQYPWIKGATTLDSSGLTICEVPVAFLKDNPKNWRTHSQRQRSTFKAFKEKHGYLGLAIFNLQSGLLVDGHMRASEAIKAGETVLPCILIDCEESAENEILATLDNIGLMAQRNTDALNSLLKSQNTATAALKTENERKLAQLRKDVAESITEAPTGPLLKQAKTRIRPTKSLPEESGSGEETIPDSYDTEEPEVFQTIIDETVLFPGKTFLGIPELLETNLATPDLAPVRTWTKNEPDGTDAYYCISNQFTQDMQVGTLGFYTDDHRFNDAYASSGAFIDFLNTLNPSALIGPDFSAFTYYPAVMALWSVYKSRWCTRLWQEAGFQVIPTIQVIDKSYSLTKEYVLQTLPRCPVIALECRNTKKEEYHLISQLISLCVKEIKPSCVVLYGGLEKQKYIHGDLPKKVDYRYLPSNLIAKKKTWKR